MCYNFFIFAEENAQYFYYDDAEVISYKEFNTQPHILWSQGDLRLVTGSDSEVISSAGRLEVGSHNRI